MNGRLASYAKIVLAVIAMSGSVACAASSAHARVPGWMRLRVGQSAYFSAGWGVVAGGVVAVCPTYNAAVRFLNSPKSLTSPKCPLLPKTGQLVTVLGWRMYEESRNWFVPMVHVQFVDGTSAWILIVGLTPVVPRGTAVVVGGSECMAEVKRFHVTSFSETLSVCGGVVLKQLASRSENLLVVRFNRTGTVVRVMSGNALYPNVRTPNGVPRYSVGELTWSGEP